VVKPFLEQRPNTMTKPPPFLSNWNVNRSTANAPALRKCGKEPVNPAWRS